MTDQKAVALDTTVLSREAKAVLDSLKEDIVGQDRALEAVVKALEIGRSPLRRKDRPLGVFLCLGPTGTGKTSLPKALARYMFKDANAITEINLNNFSESHRTSSLEGSPPGYIGYIDPASPRNAFSRSPILRQWNIDRHHHGYLEKIHADDLRSLQKKIEKVQSFSNKMEQAAKRKEELRTRIDEIEFELKDLSKSDISERQSLLARLGFVKKELSKLERRHVAMANVWWKLSEDIGELEDRALREGWIYDPQRPPSELMSIILFDEIEKADPIALNHLMTIMDEARLPLANGEETSFRNSVIFMTSNLGQEELSKLLDPDRVIGWKKVQPENSDDLVYRVCLQEAKRTFKPEFVGRFSKIIAFRPLRREHMAKIFDIQVKKLHGDLMEKNIPLLVKVDDAVKEYLVDLAMRHPEEGARVIERRFRDKVIGDLAVCFNTHQLTRPGEILVSLTEEAEDDELSYQYFPIDPKTAA